MHIKDLQLQFKKRKEKVNLLYNLGTENSESIISKFENKYNIDFPIQVKHFYQTFNGISTQNPDMEIFRIEDLNINNNIIHFCTINSIHKIGFDTSKINEADQWDIINIKTNFTVTKTMASFWSNKIWAWIDKKRNIWEQEYY